MSHILIVDAPFSLQHDAPTSPSLLFPLNRTNPCAPQSGLMFDCCAEQSPPTQTGISASFFFCRFGFGCETVRKCLEPCLQRVIFTGILIFTWCHCAQHISLCALAVHEFDVTSGGGTRSGVDSGCTRVECTSNWCPRIQDKRGPKRRDGRSPNIRGDGCANTTRHRWFPFWNAIKICNVWQQQVTLTQKKNFCTVFFYVEGKSILMTFLAILIGSQKKLIHNWHQSQTFAVLMDRSSMTRMGEHRDEKQGATNGKVRHRHNTKPNPTTLQHRRFDELGSYTVPL